MHISPSTVRKSDSVFALPATLYSTYLHRSLCIAYEVHVIATLPHFVIKKYPILLG